MAPSTARGESGHTRIDDDLLDALIAYPLSKRQYKVVLAVIRKTFGFAKAEDDLSSAQLARLTKLDPSHCRTAVRELASLGVLEVRAGHFGQWIRINAQPATWRLPDAVAAPCILSERVEEAGRNSPDARPRKPEGRAKTAREAGRNSPGLGPKRPVDRAETTQGEGQNGPAGRAETALNKRQPPIDKIKSLSPPNPPTGGHAGGQDQDKQGDPWSCRPPEGVASGLPLPPEALQTRAAEPPASPLPLAGVKRTGKAAPIELPPLPPNIPPDLWAEFLEHRRAVRSPMTPVAQRRALSLLARMAETGQDPAAVLEQSIVNGWRGLFPVRGAGPPRQPAGGVSYPAQRMARTVRSLKQIFGESDGQSDLSAGDELPGGGLRRGARPRAGGGVLGPARGVTR